MSEVKSQPTEEKITVAKLEDYIDKIKKALHSNDIENANKILDEVHSKYGPEARFYIAYRVGKETKNDEWLEQHVDEIMEGAKRHIRLQLYAKAVAETLKEEAQKHTGEVREKLVKLANEVESALKRGVDKVEVALKKVVEELKKMGQKFIDLARKIEEAVTGKLPPKVEEVINKKFVQYIKEGNYAGAADYIDYVKVPNEVKRAVKLLAEFEETKKLYEDAYRKSDYKAVIKYAKIMLKLQNKAAEAEQIIEKYKSSLEIGVEKSAPAAEAKVAKQKVEAQKQDMREAVPAVEQKAEAQKHVTKVSTEAEEVKVEKPAADNKQKAALSQLDETIAKKYVEQYEGLFRSFERAIRKGDVERAKKLFEQMEAIREHYEKATTLLGIKPVDENVDWKAIKEQLEQVKSDRTGLKL